MPTLHLKNAIGAIYPDPARTNPNMWKGFASFVQPNGARNVRLNIRVLIAEEEEDGWQYKLSFDGGVAGRLLPNLTKMRDYEPDYIGSCGKYGEMRIEGWKRLEHGCHIWIQISRDEAAYRSIAAEFI